MTTRYYRVSALEYRNALSMAQAASVQVREATTPADQNVQGLCFLSEDHRSGFLIAKGDLQGVFSLEKGRGDQLVGFAKLFGARTLDCFDGYLPTFYARHGFVETRREANWTAGGPDAVYMGLAEL